PSATRSPPRTAAASCTATSSRRTCSWSPPRTSTARPAPAPRPRPPRARGSSCSTSASRASPRRWAAASPAARPPARPASLPPSAAGPAVFSLGCVTHACLTQRSPFVGEHAQAVLAKILFEEPPRLAALRGDVPPALDALVARMLDKDPARRPADAALVAAAL